MLASKPFIARVLRNRNFVNRILSVVVDEAHVVSHWSKSFRKLYGELGMLRAFLPRGTPLVAMSATLPKRVRKDVLTKLQFPKNPAHFEFVNCGNNRPNVALIVRPIHNSIASLSDTDFIIPDGLKNAGDILKTFLYADNVLGGGDIEDYMTRRLPLELQDKGLIRPYSAGFSQEYRAELMCLFREGKVRVLICTDAAGMVSRGHQQCYIQYSHHRRDAIYPMLTW